MMPPIYVRVENVRKSKGVTKTYLAKACNKTAAWYSDISLGKLRLSVDDLEKISAALDVSPQIFFDVQLSEAHNKSA